MRWARKIVRPDPGSKSVRRVVSDRHSFVLVVKLEHSNHRTKDLLTKHLHLVAHVCQQRRRHKIAGAIRTRRTPRNVCTVSESRVDVGLDPLLLGSRNEWADVGTGI